MRGKPAGIGMRGQIPEPDRLALAHDESENAVPTWRGPDPAAELRIDPVRGEALEDPAVRSDHADRRIAHADYLCSHLHDTLKDAVERRLGDERRSGSLELPETVLHRQSLHDRW